MPSKKTVCLSKIYVVRPRKCYFIGEKIVRSIILVCAFSIFSVFYPGWSIAASFDCSKAATAVEIAICNSPSLSGLDSDVASSYKNLLATSPDKKQVKAEQRAWLVRRNTCKDNPCIEGLYFSRLDELYLKLEALGQSQLSATPCTESSLGSCNWAEICEQATIKTNGRITWKNSSGEPWVSEAKTRNLDCEVSAANSTAEQSETYVVANTLPPDDYLSLRSDPSVSVGQRIAKMPNGTVLQLLQGNLEGWARVQIVATGQKGWAFAGTDTKKYIVLRPATTTAETTTAEQKQEADRQAAEAEAAKQSQVKEPTQQIDSSSSSYSNGSFDSTGLVNLDNTGTLVASCFFVSTYLRNATSFLKQKMYDDISRSSDAEYLDGLNNANKSSKGYDAYASLGDSYAKEWGNNNVLYVPNNERSSFGAEYNPARQRVEGALSRNPIALIDAFEFCRENVY